MRRIAIHSVPRSGSTWLGQIFNSSPLVAYRYQPLFSYAFKGRLTAASTGSEICEFFREIAESDDPFLNQLDAIARGICPEFTKASEAKYCVYKEVRYHHIVENMLRQDTSIRVVGLVRNPLSVLSSWLKAPKEFHPDWNFETQWREAPLKNQGRAEEFYGYAKWKEVAFLFQHLAIAYSDRFHLVRYEDLLRNPRESIESIFHFSQLPMDDQTVEFLSESRSNSQDDPYSVYRVKNNDDDWQQTLPRSVIAEVMSDLRDSSLETFLPQSA